MRPFQTTAIVGIAVLAASCARADPIYAGTAERHLASAGIALHRGDVKRWAAKGDVVQAFCFFRAANVAEVDGRWYAINGIALSGLNRHWIQVDGERVTLEDEHKAPASLRDFLYAVNGRMNDACP